MNRGKKVLLVVSGLIAVAALVFGVLMIVKALGGNKPDSAAAPTPTIAIPEVPAGSVLVWRLAEVHEKQESEEDGIIQWTEKFTYDDLGRCTERVTFTDGKETRRTTYVYDAASKHTTVTEIDRDYSCRKSVITYNAKGNILSAEYYEDTGFSEDTEDWRLTRRDERSFVAAPDGTEHEDYRSTSYNGSGTVLTEEYLYYDSEQRREIYAKRFDGAGEWQTTAVTEFDEQGRTIAVYDFSEAKEPDYTNPVYLRNSFSYREDGSHTINTYTNGILSFVSERDADGVTLWAEEYDEKGNKTSRREWTKQPTEDGYSVKTEKRTADGILEYQAIDEYDGKGTIRKRSITRSGENECTDYLVREFDEKGRIVKETRYGIETTTYAYDSYGNCVKADFTRVEDSPCTIAREYAYAPMVLTEAQVKEAEEYYTEKYIFP